MLPVRVSFAQHIWNAQPTELVIYYYGYSILIHAVIYDVCSDILRMDSMCADAVYVRGLCLYYQDNMEKAFQHFQQVLRLAPDHSKARDVYRVSNLTPSVHC